MSPAPPAGRTYDIVVYGASSFVGRLVCKYLAKNARSAKWAAAGRSKEKIAGVLKELGIDSQPILVADSNDEAALADVAKETKVVITLVGPYALYGSKLVKVCAENGTHYLDLTGETPWTAKMIQSEHRKALVGRAIIVHSCGFDSIPSDLGAFLAVKYLREKVGAEVKVGKVRSSFKVKDTMSGGTFASALDLLEMPRNVLSELSSNPYILSPLPGRQRLENKWAARLPSGWGAVFVMAPHNGQIVRRSWGLLESTAKSARDFTYGPNFSYDEYIGVGNPVLAFFVSLVFVVGAVVLKLLPPLRWIAKRVGPKSGDGPSKQMLENGYFKSETFAWSEDGKHCARVTQRGKGSPGYQLTATMISECALSIIHEYGRLPVLAKEGGPLTTATAFGSVLHERLERTGEYSFDFDMLDEGSSKKGR